MHAIDKRKKRYVVHLKIQRLPFGSDIGFLASSIMYRVVILRSTYLSF